MKHLGGQAWCISAARWREGQRQGRWTRCGSSREQQLSLRLNLAVTCVQNVVVFKITHDGNIIYDIYLHENMNLDLTWFIPYLLFIILALVLNPMVVTYFVLSSHKHSDCIYYMSWHVSTTRFASLKAVLVRLCCCLKDRIGLEVEHVEIYVQHKRVL